MGRSNQQQFEDARKLAQFSELLSQDIEIPAICERMGIRRGNGYKLLKVLHRHLGSQAQ